ncbi:UNVERIFIED_CONTAM: hypothetical protein FKN15_014403 [Acipenser sinensis]
MLVSDQLKPGLEALCWAGEDGRDDSSCRVHAVGGSALEPELTLSKKESWTSLGVVLFFVVLKPCPTALLWTRARARRRVGSWDHLSLQFHSLFGFFSPTREGPCGPVWHRCSGTAVPPHQMADDFERGGPSFPPGEGAADLSERGREAREPSPQRASTPTLGRDSTAAQYQGETDAVHNQHAVGRVLSEVQFSPDLTALSPPAPAGTEWKIPCISSRASLEAFLAQFELAATEHGWSSATTTTVASPILVAASPPRQTASLVATTAGPKLKLLRFSGQASLEAFLAQFELAATEYGWNSPAKASYLTQSLEGAALEILLDRSR